MPLCTQHLIRLQPVKESSKSSPHANRGQFLRRLLSSPLGSRVLVASVVRRPVIVANRIDPVYLNATKWDLLVLIGPEKKDQQSTTTTTPPKESLLLQDFPDFKQDILAEYQLEVGIPSRILDSYSEQTKKLNQAAKEADKPSIESLLSNPARSHPGYEPKTSQLLEVSEDLIKLIEELETLGESDGLVDARGPVHQLNLLSFKKSKEDKERYHEYGQRFATTASPYGASPKILGSVLRSEDKVELPGWDEVSLVSYPSLRQFAAMAASEDYQSINRTYRLPSLDDTTIICTQEVNLDALRAKGKARM